jgi:uncharacterized protein YecE (DUF72 family)
MKLPGLHIGTSGWSYKHWSGVFYPNDLKPAKYLEFYITRFDCVELNSSFYHLPLSTTVSGWMKRTREPFRFCPKMSRFITHQLRLMNVEAPLKKFFDCLEEMRPRLGPVLIQLPPGLSFDRIRLHDFLEILHSCYGEHKFAFEVRNRSWITDDFFDLIARNGMAFVIADSGRRFPYHEMVTAGFIYLRFHGHQQLYASDYNESELRSYADKIVNWRNEGREVWVFFNNDFQGYAVKNAERLREIISRIFT